jgi:hypothetical protein
MVANIDMFLDETEIRHYYVYLAAYQNTLGEYVIAPDFPAFRSEDTAKLFIKQFGGDYRPLKVEVKV